MSYTPSEEFTKAVVAGMLAPLPYLTALAAKAVPGKEYAVSKALAHVVPFSLHAIAATRPIGTRLSLTTHGELTEEAKASMLKRIANFFVPGEVKNVSSELNKEIIRLGKEGFGQEGIWRLEAEDKEIVLVVTGVSYLKESADTAFDLALDSADRLKALKEKIVPYLALKRRGSPAISANAHPDTCAVASDAVAAEPAREVVIAPQAKIVAVDHAQNQAGVPTDRNASHDDRRQD